MIRLDETRYWGVENPEDVRFGDIVFAVSGNRYAAWNLPPERCDPHDSIDCRIPDAKPDAVSRYSFDLPYSRFDYALRHRPTGAPDRLDEWRPEPDGACPYCGRRDAWTNDGIAPHVVEATGAIIWGLRWKCACGRIAQLRERDKDGDRRIGP
ncbi:hypothetical protein [Bifidobacterium felsineum]|uniref:hypothetical protein n=1 Tax=Bifidobacterium felsineum TaxID=2045440 RepID=UPI001BDC3BA0|nr:hypothetical protein [Bifidobacterium felsineum]MBT1164614.1 hypothetical protein [Bifidobacterium felsineum]